MSLSIPECFSQLYSFLHSAELLEQSRRKPTALNPQRTLTLLVAMLSGFKASFQIELNFFGERQMWLIARLTQR